MVPTKELKKFHRDISALLYKVGACKFNRCAIGSIKDRSRSNIAWDPYRRVVTTLPEEDMVMIKLDIRRAFHNIPADRVEAVLFETINNALEPLRRMYQASREAYRECLARPDKDSVHYRELVFLMDLLPELIEATTYRGSLPVGYSLSPLIFNLAVIGIDKRVLGAIDTLSRANYQRIEKKDLVTNSSERWKALPAYDVHVGGGVYFRYVDDLIILTPKKNKALIQMVRKIIWSEGLELNEKKTKVVPYSSGWSALGMAISSGTCPPSKRLMKKMRGLWHRYKTRNDTKSYEILKGIVSSISPMGRRNSEVLTKLGISVHEHGRKGKWDLIDTE